MDSASQHEVNDLLWLVLPLEISREVVFFFHSCATQNPNKIAITLHAGSPLFHISNFLTYSVFLLIQFKWNYRPLRPK